MTSKQRQVRLRYPPAFIEIVAILARRIRPKKIATALQLPLSSVYRWQHERLRLQRNADMPTRSTANHDDADATRLAALIAICETHGFATRDAVRHLVPSLPDSPAHAPAESAESVRDYRSLSGLDNQATVGELRFPREALKAARAVSNVVRFPQSATMPPKQRLLVAKLEIDQHYYTRISLAQLALVIGMNKFRFIRQFRSTFGISPYQYLNFVRVEHAKHILALSKQPVAMVAASVGFTSVSSLNRAFKRFAGRSPSDLLYKIAPALPSHPTIAA